MFLVWNQLQNGFMSLQTMMKQMTVQMDNSLTVTGGKQKQSTVFKIISKFLYLLCNLFETSPYRIQSHLYC